jgi:hypothetical protein
MDRCPGAAARHPVILMLGALDPDAPPAWSTNLVQEAWMLCAFSVAHPQALTPIIRLSVHVISLLLCQRVGRASLVTENLLEAFLHLIQRILARLFRQSLRLGQHFLRRIHVEHQWFGFF